MEFHLRVHIEDDQEKQVFQRFFSVFFHLSLDGRLQGHHGDVDGWVGVAWPLEIVREKKS